MAQKRRRFDETFKRETVLSLLESGRPIAVFARSIGVERSNLHRWVKRYGSELASGKDVPAGRTVSMSEFSALKSEVDSLKEMIDHLRKIVRHALLNRYRDPEQGE
jgi:transposase-like protein